MDFCSDTFSFNFVHLVLIGSSSRRVPRTGIRTGLDHKQLADLSDSLWVVPDGSQLLPLL